jgi:hypothetical protein
VKLPNGRQALVDLRKILGYCLSATHPRGRHKARVFSRKLGLTSAQAGQLRSALLRAAAHGHVTPGREDDYGIRYLLDFAVAGPAGTGVVRSHWIVRHDEEFPRFISCHVR